MVYSKPDAPVQKSIDVDGTRTVNSRYCRGNARITLNCSGLPVAIRRVVVLTSDGTAAERRQRITPDGVEAIESR